jgi:hypothetical protein
MPFPKMIRQRKRCVANSGPKGFKEVGGDWTVKHSDAHHLYKDQQDELWLFEWTAPVAATRVPVASLAIGVRVMAPVAGLRVDLPPTTPLPTTFTIS